MVSNFGREVRYPFLDEGVIRFLSSLRADQKVSPACDIDGLLGDKILLRRVALGLGLDRAAREKKRAVCEIWWVHLEYKNNRVRQFLEPADKYLLCQGIERMTFEMCKTATNHTLSQSRNSIISFHFNSFLHSCTSTTKLNRSFFLPRRSVQAKSQSDPS